MAAKTAFNPQLGSEWAQSIERWLIHLEAWGRRPATLLRYGLELRRFAAWATLLGVTPVSTRRGPRRGQRGGDPDGAGFGWAVDRRPSFGVAVLLRVDGDPGAPP